ncbi:disulfide oxidoreductase [Patescibacteria group bacterium]
MTDTIKISKDTTIQEALTLGDDAFVILSEYFGPGCLSCGAAAFETLEMACTAHGRSKEEVPDLVSKLQAIAAKPKAPKNDE